MTRDEYPPDPSAALRQAPVLATASSPAAPSAVSPAAAAVAAARCRAVPAAPAVRANSVTGSTTYLARLEQMADQPVGEPVLNWLPPPRPSVRRMTGRYCTLERLDPDRHGRPLWDAFALDTEKRNWTYLFQDPFDTFESFAAWLNRVAPAEDPLFYSILDERHGPVGLAAYLRIAPEAGTIEVGHIHMSPLLQRTIPATEAMYLMMQQVFALGYRRYEWKCDSLNAPSRAAAERLGFSFEGIFRQALVYKGRNRDTAWYSIVDREWPWLSEAFEAWLSPANFDSAGIQRARLSDLVSSARAKATGVQCRTVHPDDR